MTNTSKLPFWSMSLLITGNVLGVGILALPIKTGLSGYLPTLTGIFVLWGMMCFTAIIIANRIKPRTNTDTSFDIPSFYGEQLGFTGKWIAIIANLILLYGVLTAYLSMIASMVNALYPTAISEQGLVGIYFVIMCVLTLFGMGLLRRSNVLLMMILWTSFIFLLFFASNQFHLSHLSYIKWALLPAGLPIIVSAFHFHNIIPTVCRNLEYDKQLVKRAIITGTFIGLLMNVGWVTVVLGGLPMLGKLHESIIFAYSHGEPATVPLAIELHNPWFTLIGSIFAILSVTASYMANGTGLLGFIRDMTNTYFKSDNRLLIAVLSFAPPLLIALTDPDDFLSALGIVGGIGEIVLFGILPAIILLICLHRKHQIKSSRLIYLAGWFTLLLSTFIFLYQLFFGVL